MPDLRPTQTQPVHPFVVWVTALVLLLPGVSLAQSIHASDVIGKHRLITLQEAIDLALQNNLDLQIARSGPALATERVYEAEGAFDTNLTTEAGFFHDEVLIASRLQALVSGAGQIESDNWNTGAGFSGVIPIGIQYDSSYTLTRRDEPTFNALDPEWNAEWRNSLVVPLLKDLVDNALNVQVKSNLIGEYISEEDFRANLRDIVQTVEDAYWGLAAAREQLRVAEKSLETANDLLKQTEVQYDVGVVSRVNVKEAEAGAADREFNFIVARNSSGTAQDFLLSLISTPDIQGYAATRLETQTPSFIPYQIEETAALEKAFARRPEVLAAQARIDDAELQTRFARNQLLPTFDLEGSYALSGLSGTQVSKVNPAPPPTFVDDGIDSGWRSAHDDFFNSSGAKSWGVGAVLEFPFGNDTARARYTQRRIELRRARDDLRRVEQSVILEVRDAVRSLRNSIDAVKAAERNRAASQETLRAEQERLRLGDATPFTVLEFEEDLVTAESQEIGALQQFRNAITALEAAQSTLLDSRGISVVKELDRFVY